MLRLVIFLTVAMMANIQAVTLPAPGGGSPRMYSSAREVLRLSRAEAATASPVELRGVVTLKIPGENRIFVQDTSGGIFVRTGSLPDVSQGDFVLVRGKSGNGQFAPIVVSASVSLVRHSALPVARRVELNEFRHSALECLFVESEGTVRSVYKVKNYWKINLFYEGFRMAALVYAKSSAGMPYPGDVVRVRGVASSIFNNKAQSLGTRLLVQDFAQTRVVRASGHDDAKLPLTAIGNLLTYSPTPSMHERVRVSGAVTCNTSDGTVCLQNGPDGLEVNTGVKQDLRLGEFIEVIGFPAVDSYSPTLEDVSIRRLGKVGHIKPLIISVPDARSGRYDGRLVEMTGTVMLQDTRSRWKGHKGRLQITLQDGDHVFAARLPDLPAHFEDEIRIGSRVSVTGVCHVSTQPSAGTTNAFSLHMRTPSDLKVIQAASWWTLEHAMTTVAALGLAVALGLCWLTLLRRKVRRQTSMIRSQLQVETALAERFRDLFEQSTDLVFTVDVHGNFTAMNHATKQALSCTGVETSQLSLHSFVGPEDLPVLTDILGILIGGQPSVLRQLSICSRRGRTLILEMNCRLRHGKGGPTSIDIIARDVTEQKREQTARENARVAAEAASRAKSEFLANMSHEIRTPMSGILGMTELTLATDLAEDQRTNLEIVRTSAEALLTIIDDILDFSKIEAGRMDLEKARFNVSSIVASCLDLVAVPAAQKGIELVCDMDPTLPSEWIGDAPRLRQVLMNLVGNAVKFTQSGEIVLRVEHLRLEDGAFRARFSVRDTGIGIPLEQHKRIFEMFCQADGSTSRQYGGTGLGLAIASRLISLMGSRLKVESAPGEGSVFSFLLDIPSTADEPIIQAGCLKERMVSLFEPNGSSRAAIERALIHAGVKIVEEKCASVVITTEDRSNVDSPLILLLAKGHVVPERLRASAIVRKPFTIGSLIQAIEETAHMRSVLALDAIRRGSDEPAKAWQNTASQRTVLLAEDNKVNQMLAVRTLEKGGYKVLVAQNGIEAVQVATNTTIDLILMDIQMPEMDGFQATARIRHSRQASGLGALPVIAMTAHALKGDRERWLSAGMTDYISKPVRPADLIEIVSRYTVQTAQPLL